jgi:hypothetical protein
MAIATREPAGTLRARREVSAVPLPAVRRKSTYLQAKAVNRMVGEHLLIILAVRGLSGLLANRFQVVKWGATKCQLESKGRLVERK